MKIAIIGRSNVGKSALFNRLVCKKIAIVNDTLGVTRDRKECQCVLGGIEVSIVDTPGVSTQKCSELDLAMNHQSSQAVVESDCVCFVIDGQQDVTVSDLEIADWLRNLLKKDNKKKVFVVINKSENIKRSASVSEIKLGFGSGISVSAEHNIGISDLINSFIDYYDQNLRDTHDTDLTSSPITQKKEDESLQETRIAIVGKPNAGKSTLINALLGKQRLLTGKQAGITRDAIISPLYYHGKLIKLIDTAGQRRCSKITDKLENIAVMDAWRYIKQSHAVVIVTEAENPMEKQDITIARKVIDEGKILIIAINKCDMITNQNLLIKDIQERMCNEFSQLPDVMCIPISAKNGLNLSKILDIALKLKQKWSSRISTSELNKWFEYATAQMQPPLTNGKSIRLKYISQTNLKPPTFTIFGNRVDFIDNTYKRYLLNSLRKSFRLSGIPLRINLRNTDNPYAKDK